MYCDDRKLKDDAAVETRFINAVKIVPEMCLWRPSGPCATVESIK
jgi:hypothetical protein